MTSTDSTASKPAARPQGPPLFVDMDGALINGDTLWESFAVLCRQKPLAAFVSLFQLLRGRAAFKRAVARNVKISVSDFNYNDAVIEFVRKARASGRMTVLATAADQAIADAVAAHLGCFDAAIASDGVRNLKGAKKAAAISDYANEKTGAAAFDYIGDSKADRPVWRIAEKAIVVAPDEQAGARAAAPVRPARVLPKPRATARDAVKALRFHQWVKNVLIFAPLFLSHQFMDVSKSLAAVIAFVCFGLTASATYIWNDLFDLHVDRRHPRKRTRALASGALAIPHAVMMSAVLILVAFAGALLFLPPVVAAMLAGYGAVTLTYSLYLKEKLLLDAMTLGFLYAYRIVVGSAATGVPVSDWLIAFSVFFFLGLALVKRFSEIETKPQTGDGRIAGRGYFASDREVIGALGVASSFMSVLILALYITSPAVVVLYERPQALWIVCFVMIYWLSRVWVLAHRSFMPDDPIVFALKDRVSWMAGAVCGAAVLAAAL
ncbi:MAG: UbiA family prenyltransferase [Parvularculaceae bacterium]